MSQDLSQRPISPRESTTPLISSDQREAAAPYTQGESKVDTSAEDKDPKAGKRRFFGLGKKKEDRLPQTDMASSTTAVPVTQGTPSEVRNLSPPGAARTELKPDTQPIPISPSRNVQHSSLAGSPSMMRSASPRRHSPASSEIFERSVQEPVQIGELQGELSPTHIPSHVITEDRIPPALEASAQAITSEDLNADEVEIVMSSSHQPAASVLEPSASQADLTQLHAPFSPLSQVRSDDSDPGSSMHQSGFLPPTAEEDGASNYGQLDPNDVRRLSFISFADVVHSEHHVPSTPSISEAGNRDSLHVSSMPSIHSQHRTASPLRSPRSTTSTGGGGVTTPPPGVNIISSHLEQSPPPSAVGMSSPMSPHGELTIETMRQAVRKTASGDLGVGRSAGMSPVSDENLSNLPRSRTNS